MRFRGAIVAVLLTFGFIAVRAAIYSSRSVTSPCFEIPACRAIAGEGAAFESLSEPEFDARKWLRRDLVMPWPRLGALGLCLLAMSMWGGPRSWGWTARLTAAGAAFTAFTAVAEVVRAWGSPGTEFSAGQYALGALATVPVALWEEACYRGLLYGGLRERFSPLASALVSSLFFAVMHWQAMPVSAWPNIFAVGMGWCAAVELGAGLPWLVFAHWAIDTLWLFAMTGPRAPWPVGLSNLGLIAAAVAAWIALTETPGAGPEGTRRASTPPGT